MNTLSNIILCGFMGAGKSTVGRLVARALNWQFADTDQIIETQQGLTVAQIFAQNGEAAFRQMEHDLCIDMHQWQNIVVATGGGMVVNPVNRENLAKVGLLVCLDASPEDILARVGTRPDRPLLAGDDPAKRVSELMEKRADSYRAIPHHVDTTGLRPEDTAAAVLTLWRNYVHDHTQK